MKLTHTHTHTHIQITEEKSQIDQFTLPQKISLGQRDLLPFPKQEFQLVKIKDLGHVLLKLIPKPVGDKGYQKKMDQIGKLPSF